MKPACTCSTFHFNSSTFFAYKVICQVLLSADIFFKISLFVVVVVVFLKKILGLSAECQAVWIQIMPVGPDLDPNCLQRLSADNTSK